MLKTPQRKKRNKKHISQVLQMYGLDYAEKSKKLDFS